MTEPKNLLLQSFPIKSLAGIYIIFCGVDQKAYIGSSTNMRQRIAEHKLALSRNRHHCFHLQHAWNKYGPGAFCFKSLELVDSKEKKTLVEYENKYLLSIQRDFLFNSEVPARATGRPKKGCFGRKWTPEQRAKLEEARRNQDISHLFTPEVRAKNLAATRAAIKDKPSKNAKDKHPGSKVDLETALKIKAEYDFLVQPGKIARGVPKMLREKYGISRSLLTNITSGNHWSNPNYSWKDKFKDRRDPNKKPLKSEVPFHCEVTLEQCQALKKEYEECFSVESKGRKRIPGLVKRLSEKHKINKDLAEKIICGRHWSNPSWIPYPKREKTEKKIISQEIQEKVRSRYDEIRQEKNLSKVHGIKETLARELQVPKQTITYCLVKTRPL